MSQACEKCCGKLIPGPHQLAGVWITCAAGKPHSAPPLSFGGWCLRLWVRSIPPPWIYNAHSMICALLSPDSLPPVGSSLYSVSHAVLRRNHWGEPLDLIPIGLLSLLTSFLDRGLFDHCACAMDVSARAAPFGRIR